MSVELQDMYGPQDMISNCCGAIAFGENDKYNCGICSKCKDHCEFENLNNGEDTKGD